MDPSLTPIIASQLNQHFQAIEAARLKAQEEHQKQILLEERQKLLSFAKDESDKLFRESTSYPQKVLVRTQILLHQLDSHKVIPKSYEDQIEKENIVLLWRKLIGIRDKCRAELRPEQLEQCTACLQAIWMQNFIEAIAQRMDAYKNFQEIKSRLDQDKRHQKKLEKIWYAGLAFVNLIIFTIFFKYNIADIESTCLGLFFVLALLPAISIRVTFQSNYMKIENTYRIHQQGPEDEAFWSNVQKKFNGIPTQATLQQTWAEQEKIIKIVFGEPAEAA